MSLLYDAISAGVTRLCSALAVIGGVVLLLVMAVVVISVTGRALVPIGLGPIPGDFELVEVGTAVAIFSFLPWCQWRRGHVSVDVLMRRLGRRLDAVLSVLYNALMTGIAAFVLWRLWAGMQDKITYNETTFILQFPVWWGYAICVPLAAVFMAVSAWSVARSIVEVGMSERRESPAP